MTMHHLNLYVLFLIILNGSVSALGSPISDSLIQAKKLNSAYGMIEFLSDYSSQGPSRMKILDINNQGFAVGIDNIYNIYQTNYQIGDGFIISADGVRLKVKDYTGEEFIPQVINDSGTIAGVKIDFHGTLTPVVYSQNFGLRVIDGLGSPTGFELVEIKDINERGTLLLSLRVLRTQSTANTPSIFQLKTYLAKEQKDHSYLATEVDLPPLFKK